MRGEVKLTNLLTENKVSLFGKVISEPIYSHEVDRERFYEFSIEVERLNGSADIIPVVFSRRLINIEEIKLNISLQVLGQYRSFMTQAEDRCKLVLKVFACGIEIREDMALNIANGIFLEGYVAKKPNYRKTPFGREISDLLIAVNRAYNESDYITCIAWGRNAKYCESFNVGDRIKVYGRIQSREYEKKYESGEVEKKVAYEIAVSKLEIINEKGIEEIEHVKKLEGSEDDYWYLWKQRYEWYAKGWQENPNELWEQYYEGYSRALQEKYNEHRKRADEASKERVKNVVTYIEKNSFKYCRNCGNKVPNTANFCDKCGEEMDY